MAHMIWLDQFNTGIDVIDGQHRRIMEYINQLHDARMTRDMASIGRVIEAMIDYTVSHFGFEESMMEEAGYPFVRPHKRVHELFVKRVSEFHLRFDAGEDVSAELHDLLSRWLFSHIRNDDMAYVEAVKQNLLAGTQEPRKAQGWLARSLGRFFK